MDEIQLSNLVNLIEHGRSSCSDDNTANGWGTREDGGYRCVKCALLEILNGTEGGHFDVDIELSLRRIKETDFA